MKDWWSQLSFRERLLVGGGASFLIIILFYIFVWAPVRDSVAASKTKIQSQQRLLVLMEQTQQKIQQLREMGITVSLSSEQPVLSLVESTLAQYQLSQYIDSVEQQDPTTVALKLKGVPFDEMMDCIESLWYRYTVQVTSMDVTKTTTRGVVDMSVVLKK